MGILVLLSLPTLVSTLRSSYLNTSGLNLMNQIALARQTAIARNLPVEVRFYKVPAVGTASTSAPTAWRAFQLFLVESTSVTPLSMVEYTQAAVVVSPAVDKSALFADAGNTGSSHAEKTPGPTDPNVTPYLKNYHYIAFRISPSGSVDVQPGRDFVTLVLNDDKTLETGGNYFTVQIDSVNGNVRSFRP